MAIADFSTLYPGRAAAPSAEYPQGSIQNDSSGGAAGDGTPLDDRWANDVNGFLQSMLAVGGVTPSGVPDTVLASDYLAALRAVISSAARRYCVGPGVNNLVSDKRFAKSGNEGVVMRPDGLRVFYLYNFEVISSDLSVPWDLSTAGAETTSGTLPGLSAKGGGLKFSPDGLKMYTTSDLGKIHEFSLGAAWDITAPSMSYQHQLTFVTTTDGLHFTAGGTVMYTTHSASGFPVMRTTLSTPWDISTVISTVQLTFKVYNGDGSAVVVPPVIKDIFVSEDEKTFLFAARLDSTERGAIYRCEVPAGVTPSSQTLVAGPALPWGILGRRDSTDGDCRFTFADEGKYLLIGGSRGAGVALKSQATLFTASVLTEF